MNNTPIKLGSSDAVGGYAEALPASGSAAWDAQRVLRNTHALLAMTLLFSAGVASVATALKLPPPGLLLTIVGFYGLLFAIQRMKNSVGGVLSVFALTGFMGYTLGPLLSILLARQGGGQVIAMALGSTGVTFFALSAWATTSKRDFSFMGGFLFAGMIIAMLAGLGAIFFHLPVLSLVVAGMVALLSAGLILFETNQIVRGGETNYVLATVSLFVSLFNLFTSLLQIFGVMGAED